MLKLLNIRFFESISDGIIVVDKNFRIKYINGNMLKILGKEIKDVIDYYCYVVLHEKRGVVDECPAKRSLSSMKDEYSEIFCSRYNKTFKVMSFPLVKDEIIGVVEVFRELEGREDFFKSVLNGVDEGIAVIDKDFNIISANKFFREMYKIGDYRGKKCYEILEDEECFTDRCTIYNVFSRMKPFEAIHEHRIHGKKFYIKVKAFPLGKDKAIVLHNDITEIVEAEKRLKNAYKELKDAYERLRELDLLKGCILTNVSHELKTPITVIKTMVDILSDEIEGKDMEILLRIKRNVLKLLDIIENLIDMARLASGRYKLKITEVFLPDLVKEAVNTKKDFAKSKNVEIFINAEPIVLVCDRNLIYKALLNLIDNAIKFNKPNGKVFIKVYKNGENVKLEVSDTGIGIPKDKINNIFEPFIQLDASIRRKYGGTGLGLAIVKRIVDLHNGEINVESEPSRGTTFTIKFKIT